MERMKYQNKIRGGKPGKNKIPGRAAPGSCLPPVQASHYLLTRCGPSQTPSAPWCPLLAPLLHLHLQQACLMVKRAPSKKNCQGTVGWIHSEKGEKVCWRGYHITPGGLRASCSAPTSISPSGSSSFNSTPFIFSTSASFCACSTS